MGGLPQPSSSFPVACLGELDEDCSRQLVHLAWPRSQIDLHTSKDRTTLPVTALASTAAYRRFTRHSTRQVERTGGQLFRRKLVNPCSKRSEVEPPVHSFGSPLALTLQDSFKCMQTTARNEIQVLNHSRCAPTFSGSRLRNGLYRYHQYQ